MHYNRLPCPLKYCTGDDGYFVLASGTTNQSRSHLPALTPTTYWADKPFRPAKPLEILDTGCFCWKPFIKLLQSSRIIYSANWIGILMAHEPTITLSQRNGYPLFSIISSIFSKVSISISTDFFWVFKRIDYHRFVERNHSCWIFSKRILPWNGWLFFICRWLHPAFAGGFSGK